MKLICSVSTSDIQNSYKKIGIDVRRFFRSVRTLELFEDDTGLRRWLPIIPGDDAYYDELTRKLPWYYQDYRPEFIFAKNLISEHSNILEVGSGYGAFAETLDNVNYTGLELNSSAKKVCLEKKILVKSIPFHEFSLISKENFDYIIAFQLLEHLSNPEEFFEDAFRCLKPNGRLIVSVPSEDSFSGSIYRGWMNVSPHHLTRWSDKALRIFPTKFNFQLDQIHHIPLESINHKWFLLTLLESFFEESDSLFNNFGNFVSRIKSRLIFVIIFLLGGRITVPKKWMIRGQTVLAIYRKP